MNPGMKCVSRVSLLIASLLAGTGITLAADDAGTTASGAPAAVVSPATQNDEIAQLKAALAAQQKQLQALQQALASQQALIENAAAKSAFASTGQVASTTPILPPVAPLPVASARPIAMPQAPSAAASKNPCEAAPDQNAVPPYLRIGSVCVMPVGFMDLTAFWRDKSAATGTLGSNFGSVPYNNAPLGNLSEYHFSVQNSRLGFRVDGDWKGMHFIGYNEFDFNGTGGATNYAVTNGAIVPRLRLFWIDERKGGIEILGGQSWSLMTPNRKGLSALPGDLFYSQVVDINYIAGLTWTRQPGVRVLFHGPKDKINFGLSIEQGDQYIGGSGGGGAITPPAALAGLVSSQLDQAQNVTLAGYLNTPVLSPDFIAKMAFDPSSRFHFELGGILSTFKTTSLAAPWVKHSTTGQGLTFGVNAGLMKSLRWVASGMYSQGEGRYLFGAAPDIIVRADGSLSAVHADSYITGFEDTIKNTLLYAYFSGDYIGRNVALDANGTTLIGYGFKGSANSNNRSINEGTIGFNQTLWRNPRYGAVNLMGQYEYLERSPWYYVAGQAGGKKTHDNTIYMNLRYTLPGSMPNF